MSMNRGAAELAFIEAQWDEMTNKEFKVVDWLHGRPSRIQRDESLIITDCKSLYDTLEVGHGVPQDKRTALEVLALRQGMRSYNQKIRWVETEEMIADPLTKPLFKEQRLLEVMRTNGTRLCTKLEGWPTKKPTGTRRPSRTLPPKSLSHVKFSSYEAARPLYLSRLENVLCLCESLDVV